MDHKREDRTPPPPLARVMGVGGRQQFYVQFLTQIMPLMFALDHTTYSMWLSVHIREMINIVEKHPDVLVKFKYRKFVMHNTNTIFSAMAIDPYHEQNKVVVKVFGGAIGLTRNNGELIRWMVAGPEIASITTQLEEQEITEQGDAHVTEHRHHAHQPRV